MLRIQTKVSRQKHACFMEGATLSFVNQCLWFWIHHPTVAANYRNKPLGIGGTQCNRWLWLVLSVLVTKSNLVAFPLLCWCDSQETIQNFLTSMVFESLLIFSLHKINIYGKRSQIQRERNVCSLFKQKIFITRCIKILWTCKQVLICKLSLLCNKV